MNTSTILEGMDQPGSVLISYSPSSDDISLSSRGLSGILISDKLILTHGTALLPIIEDNVYELVDYLSTLEPGKLILAPPATLTKLSFRIYRSITSRGPQQTDDYNIIERYGHITALWICPLLKDTFKHSFDTWQFERLWKFNRLLLPVFLVVKMADVGIPMIETTDVVRTLQDLERRTFVGTRGEDVEIVSTPFGNPIFIDSVARGIVSNVMGKGGCVMMTDANTLPGCEGAPLFVVADRAERRICGMLVASLSWCRGEWVDYTFAASLNTCLRRILGKQDRLTSLPAIDHQEFIGDDAVDNGTMVVRCGVSWGTGILVDKGSGIILTCSHVVGEAPEKDIKIVARNNKLLLATLIYKTPPRTPYDVAILQVDPTTLDPSVVSLQISNTNAVMGEPVISAGFPFFSSIQASLSSGIVSRSSNCMLQTTCCAQSGASGGPILRKKSKELLGMVVSNACSTDGNILYARLCMAVPGTVLKGPIEEYIRTGNAKVLQVFTCHDKLVQGIWNLHVFLPSSL